MMPASALDAFERRRHAALDAFERRRHAALDAFERRRICFRMQSGHKSADLDFYEHISEFKKSMNWRFVTTFFVFLLFLACFDV